MAMRVDDEIRRGAELPDAGGARGDDTAGKVTIPVSGMTCAACSSRVQRTLSRTPGVTEANVNLMLKNAVVEFDPAAISPERAGCFEFSCGMSMLRGRLTVLDEGEG
jgi:Cu+-exporting ATPase